MMDWPNWMPASLADRRLPQRPPIHSCAVPTQTRGGQTVDAEVRANNLQGFDAMVPLRSLVAVSGVSGSGKSTLITQLLVPAVQAELDGFGGKPKGFAALEGDVNTLEHLEFVDQNPIGKSSRSNPVTYVKAFDEIRSLLADTSHAKARGLKPSTSASTFLVDVAKRAKEKAT